MAPESAVVRVLPEGRWGGRRVPAPEPGRGGGGRRSGWRRSWRRRRRDLPLLLRPHLARPFHQSRARRWLHQRLGRLRRREQVHRAESRRRFLPEAALGSGGVHHRGKLRGRLLERRRRQRIRPERLDARVLRGGSRRCFPQAAMRKLWAVHRLCFARTGRSRPGRSRWLWQRPEERRQRRLR